MTHNWPWGQIFFISSSRSLSAKLFQWKKCPSSLFVLFCVFVCFFYSKLTSSFDEEMLYCWVIRRYTVDKETWMLHYARIQCTSKDKSETKPVRNDKTGIVVLLLSLTELVVAVLAILCVRLIPLRAWMVSRTETRERIVYECWTLRNYVKNRYHCGSKSSSTHS